MTEFNQIAGWVRDFPELLAVITLLAGWLVARLAERGMAVLIRLANRLTARLGSHSTALISARMDRTLQQFAFWGLLLLTFALALRLLGVAQISEWLDRLLAFVPRLLVGLAIIALGHILGLLSRSLLTQIDTRQTLGQLPQLAYLTVLVIALVTAFAHVGLDVSLISQLTLLLLGIFLGGLALAFALGARQLVANLAAQAETHRYQPGDRVRIGAIEGTVVEIYRTGITLATADGLASIPAARFAASPVIKLHPDQEPS